jgi:uncharacterized membrane protein
MIETWVMKGINHQDLNTVDVSLSLTAATSFWANAGPVTLADFLMHMREASLLALATVVTIGILESTTEEQRGTEIAH